MILVSGCLVGLHCRYNGDTNENDQVVERCQEEGCLPLCPEQLGGLSTPRVPAEIVGGDGYDVLDGVARVIDQQGRDVTSYFIAGAQEVGAMVRLFSINKAILKERSPSCGVSQLYDGCFANHVIPGIGVTAALLDRLGITIYSEEQV